MADQFGINLNILDLQEPLLSNFKVKSNSEYPELSYWQTDPLLNQGTDLIEQCIADAKELINLRYTFNSLLQGFISEGNILRLDDNRQAGNALKTPPQVNAFHRNYHILTKEGDSLRNQKSFLEKASEAAKTVENVFPKNSVDGYRSEQNYEEVATQLEEINYAISSNDLLAKWAHEDIDYNENIYQNRVDNFKINFEWFKITYSNLIYEPIKKIESNYLNAVIRLKKASEGLRKIYNYKVDIPETEGDITLDTISKIVDWSRNAIAYLSAYQQRDQLFTYVISLRDILASNWNKLETSNVSFSILIDDIKSHKNIRFRGVSATILGKAGMIPWTIGLKFPAKTVYSQDTNSVDQSKIPVCHLGRVENILSNRPVDICGILSLFNAGIISATSSDVFTIKLTKTVSSEQFNSIETILLEFKLVGIPLTTL